MLVGKRMMHGRESAVAVLFVPIAVQIYCKQSAGVALQQLLSAMCCVSACTAVLCCVPACAAVSCCAMLCHVVLAQYCVMPYYSELRCAALRCAVLCCAVLCCAVLCCAVLCCDGCAVLGWNVFCPNFAVVSIVASHDRGVQHAAKDAGQVQGVVPIWK